jgi:hypothetical protein
MKLGVIGCKWHTCFASEGSACKRLAVPSVFRVEVSARMNEHTRFERMKGGRRHVRERQSTQEAAHVGKQQPEREQEQTKAVKLAAAFSILY